MAKKRKKMPAKMISKFKEGAGGGKTGLRSKGKKGGGYRERMEKAAL